MKSRMINLVKQLAWCLLVLLIILIGVWLCFLAYNSWPIAIDSVGEISDFH